MTDDYPEILLYQVDDIHFISMLIEHLAAEYKVDRSRIYLVGFSSGGMMAQRFAMEKTGKIAAIVPIAASIPVPQMEKHINRRRPFPL